jgi:hypothetical protein
MWQTLSRDGVNGVSISWLGTLSTAPASPTTNQAYYNSVDKVSYIWNGTSWQILAKDGANGTDGTNGTNGVSISWLGTFASPPTSPTLNQAYYNSASNQSMIWNGTSWQLMAKDGTQGLQGPQGENAIAWLGNLTAAPISPTQNQAYYNSLDKTAYIWDSTAWQILAKDGEKGDQGIQGVQGAQGVQGPQGPQGIQGLQGQNAIAWLGNLTTAPTSPTKNQAYYNSIDKIAYIWDSTMWQILAKDGEKGDKGDQGIQGIQGTQGIQGIQGLTGTDGISIQWLGSLLVAPSSATFNQAYYNITDGISYIWDGMSWQLLAKDGAKGGQGSAGEDGISLTWVGTLTSEPANPTQNQAYYNSVDGISYVWDGTAWQILAKDGAQGLTGAAGQAGANGLSLTWVGTASTHPASPSVNEAYYNSADKIAYVWNGSTWNIMAKDGVQGLTGAAGPAGATGATGTAGANGLSLTWLGTQSTAPASPATNAAYYNSVDKTSYVWNGSTWNIIAKDGAQGIAGPAGATGATGPSGTTGSPGASLVWLGTLSSHPSGSVENLAYYNSVDKTSYVWNGSTWNIIAKDGAVGATGAAGPAGAAGPVGATGAAGTNGTNGTNGVSISWLGSLATAPTSPTLNQGYYNSTLGTSYIWNGTSWQIIAKDGTSSSGSGTGTSSPLTHYIGELYQGGIIVSLWKTGGVEHGLIASLTDIDVFPMAYSNVLTTAGNNAKYASDGELNTTTITAQAGNSLGAAKQCADYVSGGYSDWYLPSIWELKEIYNASFIIAKVLGESSSLLFKQSPSYWSSTEDSSTGNYAWYFSTDYGSAGSIGKEFEYYVRAVRKF